MKVFHNYSITEAGSKMAKLEQGFDESRRMAIAQIIEMIKSKGMVSSSTECVQPYEE